MIDIKSLVALFPIKPTDYLLEQTWIRRLGIFFAFSRLYWAVPQFAS